MMKWKWWKKPEAKAVAIPRECTPEGMEISHIAMAEVQMTGLPATVPWKLPRAPQWLNPEMAMDRQAPSTAALYNWAVQGAFTEGIGFLGYAYLSELSQRPEYRRMVEIIAAHATRKWLELKGEDKERIKKINDELDRFEIRAKFREAAEHDGFFGRSQIFIDFGHDLHDGELATPLPRVPEKVSIGSLKGFTVVEPFWSYPGAYNTSNPLSQDFYVPRTWNVYGGVVDASRLLSFVGREVPDLLKPAYQFGGLALTQMAKPYVDNWLRTRQSVSDLVHSFSTMILSTDLSQVLGGGKADQLLKRLEIFNRTRDNRGIMAINKASEELSNVNTPLSGIHDLQSQAQEHMSSVSGIPLVILTGITPSGLNASSDGEIQVFYDSIEAYQERIFRPQFQALLELVQLNLDGEIDPDLTFAFVPLQEKDEKSDADIRKTNADIDKAYVDAGVVSPDEVRERIATDETSPYHGVDLSAPAPVVEEEEPDNGPSPAKK